MRFTTRFLHAALIATLGCLLAIGCSSTPTTGKGNDPGQKSVADKHAKVNKGMSEKEVTDIMGSDGTTVDTSKVTDMLPGIKLPDMGGGLPGMPDIGGMMPKLIIKTWEEGDTVYAVILQDGKVIDTPKSAKKEKKESKITKANSDKIKPGMKKLEVEEILGKGKGGGGKMEGFPGAEVMIWDGDEGIITIGFIDDKVVAAAAWQKK